MKSYARNVSTKVVQDHIAQMERSFQLMGVDMMDLMQIHNLRDVKSHLPVLGDWKQQGRIRYVGVTTSHGRNHSDLEALLKKEPLDFVQLSYNIEDRAVEQQLLPLAQEKGIAVIANRAFQRGSLFAKVKGKTLPAFARELDINSWGQFFLKYVVSHPAVTCAIPATDKLKHIVDNMGAGVGKLPDKYQRKEMEAFFSSL